MKSYLIKNKKYTFMIIFFISLFFIPFKVSALVSKGSFYQTYSSGETHTGSISANNVSTDLNTYFSNSFDATGYDILAIPFNRFNITTDNYFFLDNPVFSNGTYDIDCLQNNGDFCTKYRYHVSGGQSIPQNLSGSIGQGDFTILFELHSEDEVHVNACYLSDELQGFILCPTAGMTNAKYFKIRINQYGFQNFDYNIDFLRVLQKFNHESSEIISALSQLGTIQQSTTTTIQNFNNYVSDTNTTQSENASTTALGGITTEFNSHLSDMNQLTQLAFVPVNFIINIADSTCQPLIWEIPFVNQRVVVPCMSTIYNGYFSVVVGTFSIIMTSLLTYRCCLKLFNTIKGLLDAEDDKIEVVDL